MKQKNLLRTLGCAAMMAAFGLVACGDDSSSVSNQCEALDPECGYTVEELCRMGEKQYCPEQSSSSEAVNSSSSIENGGSSSSVAKSSSSGLGETCIHISDSDSAGRWDCTEPDYTLKEDCGNPSALYMCAAGMWIEAKDCDPSQERCGYSDTTLCTQFGIMEYCDGPSSIFPVGVPCNKPGKSVVIDGQWMYRCDNGKWHVVVPLG